MIKVRTSKTSDVQTDPSDRYKIEDAPIRNGLPQAIGLAILSVALYLRSMVTSPLAALRIEDDSNGVPPKEQAERGQQIADDRHLTASARDDTKTDAPQSADQPARDVAPPFHISDGGNVVSLFQPQSLPGLRRGSAYQNPASHKFTPDAFDPNLWDSFSSASASNGPSLLESGSVQPTSSRASLTAEPAKANRAPVRHRSVYLSDLFGTGAVLITLSSLLDQVSDADADILSVRGLTASTGTLTPTTEGYLYIPDSNYIGVVQFAYSVSDGIAEVAQMAHFNILPNTIEGGDGGGRLMGSAGADFINGGAGNDMIDGFAGNDVITGGDGDDRISGGDGNDQIFGGNGSDTLFGNAGDDWISGGAGNDEIYGGSGNDILFGDAGNDAIYGGADQDMLFGGDGDDVLDGGEGGDVLAGGAGADLLNDGDGADIVFGGSGSDTIRAASDGADDQFHGDDPVVDSTDFDTLDYADATQRLEVNLAEGTVDGVQAGHDTFDGIEKFIAGSGDDDIIGSQGNDIVQDGAGRDIVMLGDGDDIMVVSADANADSFDGGTGRDTLDLSENSGNLIVNLTRGTVSGDGTTTDQITNFEIFISGAGDDVLIAKDINGGQSYDGGVGRDSLDLSNVNVGLSLNLKVGTVEGRDGQVDQFSNFEVVIGTSGDDLFLIGSQNYTLSGGGGNNRYDFGRFDDVYENAASILDFSIGDMIQTRRFRFFESLDSDQVDGLQFRVGDPQNGLDLSSVRLTYETEAGQVITRMEVHDDDAYGSLITMFGYHAITMTFA